MKRPPADDPRPRTAARLWAVGKWFFFAVVAGLLILAHGCHGDEDNELLNSAATLVVAPHE